MTNMMSLCYHYAMKTTISFRLDSYLKSMLEQVAEKEHRSVNNLLEVITEEYVRKSLPLKHYPVEGGGKIPKIGDIVGGTPFPSPITDEKIWQAYVDEHMATTVRSELGDYPYRDKCRTCPYSGTIRCTITGKGFGGLACTLEREEKRKEKEDGHTD